MGLGKNGEGVVGSDLASWMADGISGVVCGTFMGREGGTEGGFLSYIQVHNIYGIAVYECEPQLLSNSLQADPIVTIL